MDLWKYNEALLVYELTWTNAVRFRLAPLMRTLANDDTNPGNAAWVRANETILDDWEAAGHLLRATQPPADLQQVHALALKAVSAFEEFIRRYRAFVLAPAGTIALKSEFEPELQHGRELWEGAIAEFNRYKE